ncbi:MULTISPECIES: hypothetical protein [Saccharothrix]|uniref:hypothetical protein n=1 Tax=Saccharothrix TaxID=2071 RepID=UPI00093CB220|nr:hypothetical protein [Saccharothrix sp. CB00851]OKI38994.1 hypothetical protein A6A25_01995 [Saccharothrix sp. CB00851]
MSTTTTPLPGPDEFDPFAATVAELERYVAAAAPTVPAPAAPGDHVRPVDRRGHAADDEGQDHAAGDTRRVRGLRAEVAEAHALLALQDDTAPLLVDTKRVRRALKRSHEAARLHTLGQNPMARAWQAARVRLVLTVTALVALVGALGWSTTGVHHTLTLDMTERGAAWWGAWAVEPVISAILLVVVGAKAFLTTRGKALHHPHLTKVEFGALGVTLTLNVWPYLPIVADTFKPMTLLAHAIGPLVAVGAVTVLPIIWDGFAHLDHTTGTTADDTTAITPAAAPTGVTGGVTGPQYSANTFRPAGVTPSATDAHTAALTARARRLVAAGHLPADPSAKALRAALECGTDHARAVRDALREDPR